MKSTRTRSGRALLPLAMVKLLACSGVCPSASSPTAPDAPMAEREPVAAAPSAPAEDPAPAAVPTTVRVVNDTSEPIVLSRSFGPAEPFGIGRLESTVEPFAELDEQDDAESGRWVSSCECACGPDPCPMCEPPREVRVTLAPGDAYELAWSGRFRRAREHPEGGMCFETFDPPAGSYVLVACSEDGRCGREETTLPAHEAVTVRMSARSEASSCGGLAPGAAARAGRRLLASLAGVLRDRPVRSCPEQPSCVEPGRLEAELGAARARPCSLFVIPRGSELEARAFLPLPATHHGGESFANFFDPDATRVFRARYEQ